jgi:chromosome segregation ATPase
MRKALLWIAGILAAIFIGGILVDRRHTYEARRRQIKEKRERLESEGEVIDKTIAANAHLADEKRGELTALEKKRAAIRDKAARLHKAEVSYDKALARLGHDPADWDRLGLGD